jgi:multiple sugar transport system ATP-binding protein
MATIELHRVEKKFGDVFAVKPMSLTVNNGEFVALLGPSGCGKTTTLRMMSGLETVSAGKITLDGKDITWLKPADRNMAFVFQFYALYPHINVRDNIAFPLRAEGMARSAMDVRVAEVVELLQIGHLLKQRPGKLSGGDKQRVALARALVRRPAAFSTSPTTRWKPWPWPTASSSCRRPRCNRSARLPKSTTTRPTSLSPASSAAPA